MLVKDHNIGFFILADEEPTINRKKFVELCEELVKRNLGVHWGINTRVTDILRDEELLPLYRKAGLIHVSLGTEAAAQLKLDRFNKEIKLDQSKKAIQLLRKNGIVAEAQFIVGLENETPLGAVVSSPSDSNTSLSPIAQVSSPSISHTFTLVIATAPRLRKYTPR